MPNFSPTLSIITLNDQKWKTNQTTSKIYKLYINGNPNRPGTHQYPYIGSKVPVVAGKRDPTVGQTSFSRIFQAVRNLQNRTTGMSSEGPKWGKKVWVGLEWPENEENRQPTVAVAAAFAGPIRALPAAVCHDFWLARSPHLALPPWPARVQGWWRNRLPRLKPDWPENGSKRPSSESTGLGEFS